ncbi:hypothetical protein [Olleya namhaensis]|uniref:Uncharacterized protein n=1 Tax=Olleya namhaensis TaxID=1144750 RepID=A0A1I3J663_9FLAO|nr:hypothetical protein [Olleya namhaensis]SFI55586.1 hypothetical protein SAMN05443431_101264 [Olleya namhaensis]
MKHATNHSQTVGINLSKMNIFSKIKDIIDRRKSLNEIYDDIENMDVVLLEKKLEIFSEMVTPKFAEIGLKNWNGKYIWYSDFNDEGIKHVVEFNVFKYYGGSFSFGNCFQSVPTLSGKKLINHRTDKSTKIIYYKRLEGWQKSFEHNKPFNPDKISTVNEQKLRKSLDKVLSNNIPKLQKWFNEKTTIEENISGLLKDVENPSFEIGQRIISTEYILAFLYKQKDDLDSAEYWIQEHFKKSLNDKTEMELIIKRIKK